MARRRPNAIELDLTIGDHALVVRTGYHGRGAQASPEHAASTPAAVATVTGGANADGSPVAPSPGDRHGVELPLLTASVVHAARRNARLFVESTSRSRATKAPPGSPTRGDQASAASAAMASSRASSWAGSWWNSATCSASARRAKASAS